MGLRRRQFRGDAGARRRSKRRRRGDGHDGAAPHIPVASGGASHELRPPSTKGFRSKLNKRVIDYLVFSYHIIFMLIIVMCSHFQRVSKWSGDRDASETFISKR
jgi:hypothetical protein